MAYFLYLFKVIICSAIFLSYYYIVLRNNLYNQYNRFYLLATLVLSWLVPLINLNILIQPQQIAQPIYKVVTLFTPKTTTTNIAINSNNIAINTIKPFINTNLLLINTYSTVCVLFLLHFLISLRKLYKLTTQYPKQQLGNIYLYYTDKENTPFSFFNLIFWNNAIDIETPIGKQILAHEMVHVKQFHTYDKLTAQLNLVVGWFNPFFWLINKELSLVHEFIADKKSVPNANKALFAQTLLTISFAGKSPAFTNSFFLSPINRRLIMLSKTSFPKLSYAQRIIALPLLGIIVVAFSLKAQGYNFKTIATNVANNLSTTKNVVNVKDTANQLPTTALVANSQLVLKDTIKPTVTIVIDAKEATAEELAEYKSYELQVFTNAAEKEKKYNVSQFTPLQKLRMHQLYTKMSHQQKASIDLLSSNFAEKFIANKPTNELINKWKGNLNYTFRLDGQQVEKETIKDASEYIGYLKMYTLFYSNDEKNSKAEIDFTSKERLASVAKAQHFFWINDKILTTEKNVATKNDLNELMIYAIKYDPFANDFNLTSADFIRIKQLYSKLNDAQKAKSPIQIPVGVNVNADCTFAMSVNMGNSF